jgi:hypothetical protein
MPKIVAELVFQSWDDAIAARDELREAGFEVTIADDVVDLYNSAAFAEVYGRADSVDAFWSEVERIVEPFDGMADSCGPVDDDYVPFEGYCREA